MVKRIGIVGGLGPEPTVVYYQSIIDLYRKKTEDEGAPNIVICSLNLKAFLTMMEADRKKEAVEWLFKGIQALQRAGADFALIAANTPHVFFDELSKRSPIPLLSIVEETAKVVSKRGLRKVGLLGTKFTMQADFYQRVFSRESLSRTGKP